MATIYSSYSKGWTPSGASVARHYRAFLTYSVTTYSDRVVVTAYSGVNLDYSVEASYTATLAATGYSTASGSGKTKYHSDGSGRTVTIISTRTYTYTRTTSAQTKYITAGAQSSAGSWTGQNMTITATITVPALPSYSVTYNANGGSGSIANQTKWYNINLTLSSGSGFSWAHHTLKGWNTAPDGSGTHYELGATYTANAALTLYAEWELNAIESRTKVNGAWKNGIFYHKVNGTWVIPYAGYIKVNGTWKKIIK